MADDTRDNDRASTAGPTTGTPAETPKKHRKGVVLGKDGKP